ncbi:hypothetical protein G6F63_014259 [Rhizopus arrhizus]|nr:hypothetical protein G6F63_014259 [Rhizopus arrhizus]
MQMMCGHRQRVARACNPVWSICWLRLPAGVAHSLWVASAGILSAHLWRAVRGDPRIRRRHSSWRASPARQPAPPATLHPAGGLAL